MTRKLFLLTLAVAGLASAPIHAEPQRPLVIKNGQTQRLPAADTIPVTVLAPDTPSNSNVARTVTSAPTYSFPETLPTVFSGDFSKTVLPWSMAISGASTAGQPSSGYQWVPNLSGVQARYSVNGAGWNQSTSTNDGRTGVAAYRTMVEQNGNGDAGAYYGWCNVGGSGKAGATHWLAMPACVILNGDLSSSISHAYLNQFEFNLSDNGNDIAAVGTVENFHRTNNTAAWGEIWMGDRWQSVGTKAINVGWSGSGKINVGLDLVPATADATWNGGNTVAVNMAANQKIIFNSTATPLNGISYYGNSLGNVYDVYNSGSGYLSRCVGNSCQNINDGYSIYSSTKAAASVNLQVTNSDTGGPSTAVVAATHGSGNYAQMVAASTFSSINSGTQSLSLGVNNVAYLTVGSDGHLYAANGAGVQLTKKTASQLPTCNSGIEGRLHAITDANSATFNATIVGGGANHVLAYCNGTNWTVH